MIQDILPLSIIFQPHGNAAAEKNAADERRTAEMSHIQLRNLQRVVLDELAPWLHLVAHQGDKKIISGLPAQANWPCRAGAF
jgi:hypothetical protein